MLSGKSGKKNQFSSGDAEFRTPPGRFRTTNAPCAAFHAKTFTHSRLALRERKLGLPRLTEEEKKRESALVRVSCCCCCWGWPPFSPVVRVLARWRPRTEWPARRFWSPVVVVVGGFVTAHGPELPGLILNLYAGARTRMQTEKGKNACDAESGSKFSWLESEREIWGERRELFAWAGEGETRTLGKRDRQGCQYFYFLLNYKVATIFFMWAETTFKLF